VGAETRSNRGGARMADSPVLDEPDHERRRGHAMFDWGLFGWFALLSWTGAILVVLSLAIGR
jgi:hypothetical protein